MLKMNIDGQALTIDAPVTAAGTIDYLEAECAFSPDWDALDIWAQFRKGDTTYSAELENGRIGREKHLNLSEGVWEVSLRGEKTEGGEVTRRVTTQTAHLFVHASGAAGEPFPEIAADAAEQILAKANQALEIAEDIEARADAGDFDGEPGTTSWDGITDKPETFAPEAHGHEMSDIEGLVSDMQTKVNKATKVNGHPLSEDVTITPSDVSAVTYAAAQSLTDAQKKQARTNIGAKSVADGYRFLGRINVTEDVSSVMISRDEQGNPFVCDAFVVICCVVTETDKTLIAYYGGTMSNGYNASNIAQDTGLFAAGQTRYARVELKLIEDAGWVYHGASDTLISANATTSLHETILKEYNNRSNEAYPLTSLKINANQNAGLICAGSWFDVYGHNYNN